MMHFIMLILHGVMPHVITDIYILTRPPGRGGLRDFPSLFFFCPSL